MVIGKAITALVNGGLKTIVIISTATGSTVKLDGITGTEVSGTWTFNNVSLGTHTITLTQGQRTKTETLVIDVVGIYQVTIGFTRTELECSTANQLLCTISGNANNTYYKTYADMSVCCVGHVAGSHNGYQGAFLVSRTSNGAKCTYNQTPAGTITYNGDTWYYSDAGYWVNGVTSVTGNYTFDISNYTGVIYSGDTVLADMAKDLLDYYYGYI